MIDFLIKSTISLTVFIGFYHFVLERERIHVFNRFYLLATIVISFLIPFITFEFIKIVPIVKNLSLDPTPVIINNHQIKEHAIPMQESINYTPYIIWGIYGIVVFVLIMRFIINLFELISKSRTNPLLKYKNANLVLVHEKISPHTFLNFIYINIDEYNKNAIEEELFTHELVHVTEKHTLDILFVELLKCIFWFNPLLYFYKKAIQLNHEFLADEKVVNVYSNIPYYQNLLLQKSSNVAAVYLTTNLNYLITKKRLIMMTKSTTRKIALLKKITVLPIILMLFYLLCFEVIAQESKPKKEVKISENKLREIHYINYKNSDAEYYKGVRCLLYENAIYHNGKIIKGNLKINKLYEELTNDEIEKFKFLKFRPNPLQKISPSSLQLKDFQNAKKYAIWIDDKNVDNASLKKYSPNDFAHFSGSVVLKNARTKKHPQPFQYWFFTKSYFKKYNKDKYLKYYPGDTILISINKFSNRD